MLVAEGKQQHKHGMKIAPARGGHIFVTRRALAVAPPLQEARFDQRIEPAREHVGSDAKPALKFVEPPNPVERIAQNEHAPPLADASETACNRASHAAKVLAMH